MGGYTLGWLASPITVARFQDWCSVRTVQDKSGKPTTIVGNRFLYWLFTVCGVLGREEFFSILFFILAWNLDRSINRQLMFVWGITLFVGQALKDLLKVPRPAAPPVIHLEHSHLYEYALPSTHAMVATTIPFTLIYFSLDRWIVPLPLALGLAALWCAVVSISRVYMGVHTLMDIMVGVLLSCMMLPWLCWTADWLEANLLCQVGSCLWFTCSMFALSALYPSTEWTPQWADSAATVAAVAGIYFGGTLHCLSGFSHGMLHPQPLSFPTIFVLCLVSIRIVCGAPVVFGTGKVVKLILQYFINEKIMSSKWGMMFTKFVRYFTMAVCTSFVMPVIFFYVGGRYAAVVPDF